MNQKYNLILWFASGVVAQVLMLLRGYWGGWRMVLCAMAGSFAYWDAAFGGKPVEPEMALVSLGIFAFTFAIVFHEEILPSIGEHLLLSYTLTFWFSYFSFFYEGTTLHRYLTGVACIPSAYIILLSFSKDQPGPIGKLTAYLWFLCINVSLGLMLYATNVMSIFYSADPIPWVSSMDVALAGMSFLYIGVHVSCLYYFIPIPGKSQSWKSRMQEWREYTDVLIGRVNRHQLGVVEALAILFFQGGFLLANSIFRWFDSGILISLLVVMPLPLSILLPGKSRL